MNKKLLMLMVVVIVGSPVLYGLLFGGVKPSMVAASFISLLCLAVLHFFVRHREKG